MQKTWCRIKFWSLCVFNCLKLSCFDFRVAINGELAPECLSAYYQFGRALLYKAQEEADPLGQVPKKEAESQQVADDDGSVKSGVNGVSSAASFSNNAEKAGSSNNIEGAGDNGMYFAQ